MNVCLPVLPPGDLGVNVVPLLEGQSDVEIRAGVDEGVEEAVLVLLLLLLVLIVRLALLAEEHLVGHRPGLRGCNTALRV
jgi:hypothetical protein